jgi:peptidoglycan/LPS O-acetylase OafA/YrhL
MVLTRCWSGSRKMWCAVQSRAPNRKARTGSYRDLVKKLRDRLQRHTSDGRYRPEIDGLRFFAIALVIFGHLAERCLRSIDPDGLLQADGKSILIATGQMAWRGVLLFFTISGFIIATQFLKREESALSRSFLRRYFSRRVLRIEPPYFIILICTYVFVSLTHYVPPAAVSFDGLPRSMTASLLASLAYAHGLLFGNYPRLFPPGWSLEMEVQFYALAPLAFWLFFSVRGRLLRSVVGAITLGALLCLACSVPSVDRAPFLQRSIIRYAPYFWMGILIADWQGMIRSALARSGIVGSIAGWAGALSLIAIDRGSSTPLEFIVTNSGILLSVFLMFLGALAAGNSFSRFCSIPFVAIVGGECYSIYLTHLQPTQILTPLLVRFGHLSSPPQAFAVTAVIEIPIILVVATVFYLLIERPFMVDNWPTRLVAYLKRSFMKSSFRAGQRKPADRPADLT